MLLQGERCRARVKWSVAIDMKGEKIYWLHASTDLLSRAHNNRWTIRLENSEQCSLCHESEGAIPYYYLPLPDKIGRWCVDESHVSENDCTLGWASPLAGGSEENCGMGIDLLSYPGFETLVQGECLCHLWYVKFQTELKCCISTFILFRGVDVHGYRQLLQILSWQVDSAKEMRHLWL